MKSKTLLAVNTFAQYTRTLINVVLGLYSTRLVLQALGDSDFGIYTLIAGVVFLLSFVSNAMSTTSQRFLSFHRGSADFESLKSIFGNIIYLHLLLIIAIVILLEIASIFLFDGFLNIPSEKMHAAKITYQCVVIMVICTCLSSPYRGLLISHENLIFISIIDILDGLLKLVIAYLILNWTFLADSLIDYAFLLTIMNIINLIIFVIYCNSKYEECILPRVSTWNRTLIKQMSTFAGWVIYSTFMIVGRNQGTAIVLNKFYSTIINTAFGIAIQVNSACTFISGSILNAFNPRIIKAEGEQKRSTALKYAVTSSKLCYLMMLTAVIPLCFYIEPIMNVWLGDTPVYAILLTRVVLITTLCDQITTGLSIINKAVGKLKIYALTVDTAKILTIPVLSILLLMHVQLNYAILSFIGFELLSAILRLPILKYQCGISILEWTKSVIVRLVIPTICLVIYYACFSLFVDYDLIIIMLSIFGGCIFVSIVSYIFAFNQSEKNAIKEILNPIIRKIS